MEDLGVLELANTHNKEEKLLYAEEKTEAMLVQELRNIYHPSSISS